MTGPETKAVTTRPQGTMLERLLAVAKTPDERATAFALAERAQQQRMVQELAAEIKAKSWGTNVSTSLRTEIVRWGLQHGADPISEIDILAGTPYLNARYWQRLVVAEPDYDRPEEIWVHDDPRATEEVRKERMALRVKWAIPDEIAATVGLHKDQNAAAKDRPPLKVLAAVIVRLHFKGRGPYDGKKWTPSRANDDVGLDFPESTCLTRAWRKAALVAVKRNTPFTARMKQLIQSQEQGGPEKIETPIALPETDAIEVEALAHGGEPVTTTAQDVAPARMVKHNPSAICGVEGEHPATECKLEKKA